MTGPEALVVEDSHIGVTAAADAGCRILATYNGYTATEDLSRADAVVSCLGDADGERAEVRSGSRPLVENGEVTATLALELHHTLR